VCGNGDGLATPAAQKFRLIAWHRRVVSQPTNHGVDGHQLESFMTAGGHLAKFHFKEVDGLDSLGDVAIGKVEH
jgi:hypothetical protein